MRKSWLIIGLVFVIAVGLGLGLNMRTSAQSTLNCQACHGDVHAKWAKSPHANTQTDVADELAEERAGQTPDEVLHGEDAEDCIACHGPTAILANGGMSETQALSYFFTTTDGKFTADTTAIHTDEWPNVACIACHDVPSNHPASMPTLALFDSRTGKYASVNAASELCGQCHGDLRFPDTDHRTYNAWSMSKHSDTQADVASELARSAPGRPPTRCSTARTPKTASPVTRPRRCSLTVG